MITRSRRFIAVLKATFAVVVWGASFVATKLALREVTPVVVIWLRFGIGVIILGWFVVQRKEFAFPTGRELGYFALLGFACIFRYDALKELAASQVGSFLYLEPLVAVVVAALLLQEPLFIAAFIGGALILAGVWLVNRRTTIEIAPE